MLRSQKKLNAVLERVHKVFLVVRGVLLESDECDDVRVLDLQTRKQHIKERVESVEGKLLVHGWKYFIELIKIRFNNVDLIDRVEASHLRLFHLL